MRKLLLLLLFLLPVAFAQPAIQTGADRSDVYLPLLKNKRVGLLVNHSARVGNQHLIDVLLAHHVTLRKIFVPEHGLSGRAEDGARIKNSYYRNIPVVSLYGKKTKPTAADLKNVDVLLFDIQDVGVRFFTFTSSLQRLMEAAVEQHKPLIILDRPNPNGFYVDGPVPQGKSFTGLQAVPIVYGMTVGEYANMLKGEQWLDVKPKTRARQLSLTIILNHHYTHQSYYEPPVPPSPNLPSIQSIYWYPVIGMLEGTAISVGRGTDKPFQVFGHPQIQANYSFIPRSMPAAKNPLYENQVCHGWNLAASKEKTRAMIGHQLQIKYYLLAYQRFPDKKHFFPGKWQTLKGQPETFADQVRAGLSEAAIRASWQPRLQAFKKIRQKYLLYPDALTSHVTFTPRVTLTRHVTLTPNPSPASGRGEPQGTISPASGRGEPQGTIFPASARGKPLPQGFVYLSEIDPTILQEMRYAGDHNFVGHKLPGYATGVCILTKPAAQALAAVQAQLRVFSLSLKVYDCYRPTQTVAAFYAWSQDARQQEMKQEFYPDVNKKDLFKLGYIAKQSGHCRGSTVDVTLVPLPTPQQASWHRGQRLVSCIAPLLQRFHDNSIDMGTGFDCLDEHASYGNQQISVIAQRHRDIFRQLMIKNGFIPYDKEWWHFTLKNEPFPRQIFNFEVK